MMSRMPTFREIGERIRRERENKGLKQKDLAAVLGVTRPVVTKIEAGTKAVNSIEIRMIADHLGVSVELLTAPIAEESLAVRFRRSGASDEDLEHVAAIDKLVRDMVAQVKMKEQGLYGSCN